MKATNAKSLLAIIAMAASLHLSAFAKGPANPLPEHDSSSGVGADKVGNLTDSAYGVVQKDSWDRSKQADASDNEMLLIATDWNQAIYREGAQ